MIQPTLRFTNEKKILTVKYTDGPFGFSFVTHLVPNFCKEYMDDHCGMHFVTHLVNKS
ncbi:hypothetical protein Hanom_Chr08g00696741 [Helianthus anomalus]